MLTSAGWIEARGNGLFAIHGLELGAQVRLRAEHGADPAVTVTVAITARDQVVRLAVAPAKLEPSPRDALAPPTLGRLLLSAKPWASVTIDGQPAGTTPRSVTVAAGSHTVTFTKGAATVTKRVQVQAGATLTVMVDMTEP